MRRTIRAALARRALLALAGVALFLAAPASAQPAADDELEVRQLDILELENGQRLEGEVTAERADEVVFRLGSGAVVTQPRASIRRILRKNPPEQVYARRVAKYLDPSRVADHRELARWCLEPGIGLTSEAIHHLEEAARLVPAEVEPYETLLGLYAARELSSRSTELHDRELATCLAGIEAGVALPGLSLHAAKLLVALEDPQGAIHLLESSGGGGDAAAEDLLAALLDEVGRLDDARALVARLLAERTGVLALPLWRLEARWLLEDAAAGVAGAGERLGETIGRILAVDPEDGRAHLLRGSLALLDGDLAAARSDFQKAYSLGEADGEAALTFALCFARAGEPRRALDLVANARSATGVADLLRLVEAYARENLGERELAADVLREVPELAEATWQAWVLSLQGRIRLGEALPLAREVDRGLERFGANPAAFAELAILRGDAALGEGRPDEARRWLGYAVAAGRTLPEVHLRLGIAHLGEGGDLRRARAALEQAVAAAPADPDIRNAIGCLEYQSGNLAKARAEFEAVLRLAPAPAEEGQPLPPARAYAKDALEQVDRAQGEEVWTDDFERADGPQILNNWEKRETYGIAIVLAGGVLRFSGTQQFQSDGLTKLQRPVDGPTLARIRARLRITDGSAARIGIRLARSDGSEEGEGIVLFREPDGTIAVALNTREDSTTIRSDATGELAEGLELVPTRWPTDGEPHLLELRLPRPGEEGASVYLDGRLVIRGLDAPRLAGKGTAFVGVSGQAELDAKYRFEVLDFELFRRRPRAESGGTNR